MQDLYYSNMRFAWVPEDENFSMVLLYGKIQRLKSNLLWGFGP